VSGTPGFLAPETLYSSEITEKSDLFSCGIVLYYMLSGKLPFCGFTFEATLLENKKNIIDYYILERIDISEKAIDFIKNLTERDPINRMNANQALKHVWIEETMEKPKKVELPEMNKSQSDSLIKYSGSLKINNSVAKDKYRKSQFYK